MTLNRKPLLTAAMILVLVFAGAGWLTVQSVVHRHDSPIVQPGSAFAEDIKYTCGMHPMIITDEPGTCPICGMDLTPLKSGTAGGGQAGKASGERKIKYWVAPMDPTYIRDEPGKSPMGMDLVPVYDDEAPGGSVIAIDPVTAQNMGVRTAPATRRDLARTIRTVGLVGYQESEQYSVNTKISGWIERLHVNETGQQVKKGQKLLEVYSPELVSAQEEFLLALKNSETLAQSPFPSIAESGRQLLEASRRRLQLWDISARSINQLEQTRSVSKTLPIYAPYSGVVTMKMVQEGQFVKSGMELMKISDLSKVWVLADIYEYELPWVEVGQDAEVRLPFVGGKTLHAQISYLYPYVEARTRTVKARLEFANPDFELKPEMYVNVRIKGSEVKNVLTVPAEAIINSGEKQLLFVALGEGKFEPRQVKVGLQDEEGHVQIIEGLLEGERVVTSAQFLFDSESRLREAIQKMQQPRAEPQAPAGPDGAGYEDLFDAGPAEQEDLEDLF
jgi:Cu(I)/Ag(I) efflux system membrane fusion protein/cobalt-zinc-cadmium efflux system membrane fusion protein